MLCYVLQMDNIRDAQDWLMDANPTGRIAQGSIAINGFLRRETSRHGIDQSNHA